LLEPHTKDKINVRLRADIFSCGSNTLKEKLSGPILNLALHLRYACARATTQHSWAFNPETPQTFHIDTFTQTRGSYLWAAACSSEVFQEVSKDIVTVVKLVVSEGKSVKTGLAHHSSISFALEQ